MDTRTSRTSLSATLLRRAILLHFGGGGVVDWYLFIPTADAGAEQWPLPFAFAVDDVGAIESRPAVTHPVSHAELHPDVPQSTAALKLPSSPGRATSVP